MQSLLYHAKRPGFGLVQQAPTIVSLLIQRPLHRIRLPLHWSENIQEAGLSPANHKIEPAGKPKVICSEVQCRVSEGRRIRREVRYHCIHRWVRSAVKRFDVFHIQESTSKHGRGACQSGKVHKRRGGPHIQERKLFNPQREKQDR